MDNTVKCRPPPMGLFLLIERRRLKAAGLSWTNDPVLNQEHRLWPYWLGLRPPKNSLVE